MLRFFLLQKFRKRSLSKEPYQMEQLVEKKMAVERIKNTN